MLKAMTYFSQVSYHFNGRRKLDRHLSITTEGYDFITLRFTRCAATQRQRRERRDKLLHEKERKLYI